MKDMEQKQYIYMDTEELRDLLVSIRRDIAKKIRILASDFRALTRLQNKQDKVEERLEELGGRISVVRSKAKDWEQEW